MQSKGIDREVKKSKTEISVHLPAELRGVLKERKKDTHKGSYGKVGVVAGSKWICPQIQEKRLDYRNAVDDFPASDSQVKINIRVARIEKFCFFVVQNRFRKISRFVIRVAEVIV